MEDESDLPGGPWTDLVDPNATTEETHPGVLTQGLTFEDWIVFLSIFVTLAMAVAMVVSA